MQHNHTGEKQYNALAIDSRSPVESPLGIPGLSKEMLVKDKTSHVEVKYENASNSSQDQGASVSTRDDALDFAPTQQKTAVISVLLVDDHALMREGLKQAIRPVHQGGVLIEPELTGAIVREFRRLSNSTQTYVNALSGRDIEILRYVAAGMSNKEIAVKLSYSEKTVKNYLSLIFQKLGIRDRTQAAIFALRQGFLPDDEI